MRALLFIATATLAAAVASAAGESADPYASARAEFQQAYAQAGTADPAPAANDSASLKSYPLYPYLQAERLRKALGPDSAASEDVDKRAAAFVCQLIKELPA